MESSLYELLELLPDATDEDIKKAFRKQSIRHHPDKGGDAEVSKQLNEAKDILLDKDLRAVYGKHGLSGVFSVRLSEEGLALSEPEAECAQSDGEWFVWPGGSIPVGSEVSMNIADGSQLIFIPTHVYLDPATGRPWFHRTLYRVLLDPSAASPLTKVEQYKMAAEDDWQSVDTEPLTSDRNVHQRIDFFCHFQGGRSNFLAWVRSIVYYNISFEPAHDC